MQGASWFSVFPRACRLGSPGDSDTSAFSTQGMSRQRSKSESAWCYDIFAQVQDLDVGDIQPSQRLDFVLSQIKLGEGFHCAQTLEIADFVPSELEDL